LNKIKKEEKGSEKVKFGIVGSVSLAYLTFAGKTKKIM
jgi:hypothetical protein